MATPVTGDDVTGSRAVHLRPADPGQFFFAVYWLAAIGVLAMTRGQELVATPHPGVPYWAYGAAISTGFLALAVHGWARPGPVRFGD